MCFEGGGWLRRKRQASKLHTTLVEVVLVEEDSAPLLVVHHQASVKDVLSHDHHFATHEGLTLKQGIS